MMVQGNTTTSADNAEPKIHQHHKSKQFGPFLNHLKAVYTFTIYYSDKISVRK